MRSAIYQGVVRHRRHLPHAHHFVYPLNFFYLALKEIPELTNYSKLLSVEKFNCLSFYRKNYLNQFDLPLMDAVKKHIRQHGFSYQSDEIYLLSHLSYFGYCYNPVSFFYCYDQTGKILEYILAEIHNTPWNERFVYVLPCQQDAIKYHFNLKKDFHISPFIPMDIDYKWYFNKPGKNLTVHLRDFQEDKLTFDATLSLTKQPLNAKTVRNTLAKYPLMTYKVFWGIYWQALKLFIKRTPFYSHPRNINE